MIGAAWRATLALFLLATAAAAEPVTVSNRSEPVLCAEKDNVAIAFSGAGIARFRIEARHPAYIGTLARDRSAPDWSDCDMRGDPSFAPPAKPARRVLYSDAHVRVVGFTFEHFWRPAVVPLRIGKSVTRDLHMIQLWVHGRQGWEEVLVLYPPDGYFRTRPLAPVGLRSTAYGSSFLIGPIEEEGRPLVRLTEVAIEPGARALTLGFARGGTARLVLAAIDSDRNSLAVTLDPPVAGGPFAMLRSMYVTDSNNDVARIAWRAPDARGWRETGIMQLEEVEASAVWAGRTTVSRHNSSAPDMLFQNFERGTGQ